MNYKQLKALARCADRAQGEERKRLVEKLMSELPKLDPSEGVDEFTVRFAKFMARIKLIEAGKNS